MCLITFCVILFLGEKIFMFYKLKKLMVFILVMYLIFCGKFICPVKFFFGINCPSCGLTRSIKYLLLLDFKKSFYYHPMSVFILLAFFFAYNNQENKLIAYKKIFDIYIYATAILFFIVYLFRYNKNF